jgi:hypothetical protein
MAPTWPERCCTNKLSLPKRSRCSPAADYAFSAGGRIDVPFFRCSFHLATVSIAVLHDDATRAPMAQHAVPYQGSTSPPSL